MKNYFYDLHLHSCLSPCGGDDTTPADLAGMCALAGYQIVALTDHNTVGNCAAFCKAAEHFGLLALPGMELTTAEEVHVVCLFPDLDSAHAFGEYVRAHLPVFPNRPDFFGHQYFMDEEDHILGEETALLMGATNIPVCEVAALVRSFGGTSYPAHIDHDAFSLLSNLGLWMPEAGFLFAELSPSCPDGFTDRPDLKGVKFVFDSDAHYLHEISQPRHTIPLPKRTAQAVIDFLNDSVPVIPPTL